MPDARPDPDRPLGALLVAVGPSPLSARLVRVASRMALKLEVPWHAVTIRSVRPSSQGSTERALEHLRLAEQLGAETASLTADRVPEALVAYARRMNATMLVLGASTRRSWREWLGGTLLENVVRRATDIEVHVVASDDAVSPASEDLPSSSEGAARAVPDAKDIGVAVLTTALATAVAAIAEPFISESDVIMLYVAAVTVAAFRVRLAAGLASALLSALAFNFFFTEPRFTLYVHDSHAPGESNVEITLFEKPDEVVIEVADRGTGLHGLDLERLFDKFVRGPNGAGTGAGLGLAICRAIAELHGGRVWARSREGGGAVFSAAFPRGGPQREAVPAFEDVLDQAEKT